MDIFIAINIDNDKNIKLYSKNLVNISLKVCQYICQFNLVLKMAISSLESYHLFISFMNFYPMVYIKKIKLDKPLNPT